MDKALILGPMEANTSGNGMDGKHHGQGTHTFANGDKYVGKYKDNKRNGQGTLIVGNLGGQGSFAGDKYVGGFKDDKYNGQGHLFLCRWEKKSW